MKKHYFLKSLFLAATWLAGSLGGQLWAQDVTATYLKNAGFEEGNSDGTTTGKVQLAPKHWTASDLTQGFTNLGAQTADATTNTHPGAFGVSVTPAEGGVYYFGRHSWGAALNEVFTQETSAALPAGQYILAASYKLATRDAKSVGTLNLGVAQGGSSIATATSTVAGIPVDYATYFNTTAWSAIATPFTISSEGTATISFAMNFNPGAGNPQQEAMAVDGIKIYDVDQITSDAPIDVTGFVKNQNFDLTKNDWTCTTGAQNQALATNQQGAFTGRFFENWNGTAFTGKIYQKLNGVPNGTYQLGIAAFANTISEAQDNIAVYANSQKTFLTSTTPTLYTVNVFVSNNTLEIGLEQFAAVANWVGIDNISLKYYGAADVFGLTTTDKTGDVTSDFIVNPSFETGTKAGWTFGQGSDTSVRAASGDGADGNYMFSTWNWNASIADAYDINQIVSLPAGYYVLQASAAYHTHNDLTLYAGASTTNLARLSSDAVFNTTAIAFAVPNFSDVKIGLRSAEGTTGNDGWFKCDNFRLYRYNTEAEAEAQRASLLPALVLDQAAPLVIPQDVKNVSLNRPLVAGWNSLVVPFALGTEKLAELGLEAYEYNGTVAEGGNLLAKFAKATSMDANKPYVVKVSSPIENITLGATTIEAANTLTVTDSNSNYDLVGLYTVNAQGETSPIKEGDYIVIADGIKRTQGGNGIKAFRAFLQKKEASGARQLVLSMDGETVTGIEALGIERALTESYDLNGRRAGQDAKGILIVNGKKVVK